MSGMNFTDILARLEAAREDPKALALATLDICLAGRDPLLARAVAAAAIPHWFDASILRALLPDEAFDAEQLLQDLAALPMVESFAARDGWNVHELTRLALRERMAQDEPASLVKLSVLAAEHFDGDDAVSQIERLYHQFGGNSESAAGNLYALYRAWDEAGRHEPLQALGVVLDELARGNRLAPAAEAQVKLRLGLIRSDRLTTAERMALARRALELLSRGTGDIQGLIDALDFLGDTQAASGDLAEALTTRIEFHKTAKAATEREPPNLHWRKELSVSHHKIGNVFQAQGKLDKALAEIQTGMRIMAELVALDPANTGWQRDLSVSHNCVGNIFLAQGKLDEALAEFHADKRIMAELVALDPANTGWQRDLAVSHNKIGNVFQAQGKLDDGLAEFHAYKRIIAELVALDPANTGWQRDLSIAHNNVGSILLAQSKLDKALAEFQAALRIAETLAALDPSKADWQKDVRTVQDWIASL